MEMQIANTFSNINFYALWQQISEHMKQYFWQNRLLLHNKYFQSFDRLKTRRDQAKIGLAVQQDRPLSKIILSPEFH